MAPRVPSAALAAVLTTVVVSFVPVPDTGASCPPPGATVSLDDVVDRLEQSGVRYAFVGEQHGVGPVKRFAVDLANALVDRGEDVGLYVEGFRVDCDPRDEACWSLSQAFNRQAFLALLDNSRAPVHPLDPAQGENRVASMAATIAAGAESIKIVLVGTSHVIFAGDPDAVHPVFGGGMLYPDPGDVAEAFPRADTLIFTLDCQGDAVSPYVLRPDGCRADYVVFTAPTGQY